MRGGTRLHRRCQSLLDTLSIPHTVDLEAVRAWAAAVRGRPVQLRAMPEVAASPTGLWIATDTEDLVLVQAHTSALHARHIAFHEIAHMLWQHENTDHASTAGPLPHLDLPVVRRVLARGHDSGGRDGDRREQEAEMLATILSARAASSSAVTTTDGPVGVSGADRHGPHRPLEALNGWLRGLFEMVAVAAALHRLRPLWEDLRQDHQSAPVLRPGWTTLVTPAGWRFRLLRRVIEIRDAQVALRDYAAKPPAASAVPGVRQPTLPPYGCDPVAQARWLASARRARGSGAAPTGAGRALPLVGGSGLDEEVAALLALAAAWSNLSMRRRGHRFFQRASVRSAPHERR